MAVSGQTGRHMSADPRVLRTRATLKQALMQLLHHADWNDITISAICRRAGIARSSFYEHFAAKADVLDEIFADRMDEIRISAEAGEPLGTLEWLVDHVSEAPDFFAHAMSGGRGDGLLPRFRATLTARLDDELAARGIAGAAAKAAFLVGGALALLAVEPGAGTRAMLRDYSARIIS